MFPVRNIDDDGVYFMMCHIEKLDSFMNLVVKEKITTDDALLLIWMASFAWKPKGQERRPFMKSIAQMEGYFGLSDQAIQSRLKRLREAGLIETVYRVRQRTGKILTFKTSDAAWTYRKKHGGTNVHAFQKILDETFIVDTGKKKQKYRSTDAIESGEIESDDDDEDIFN